MKTIYKYPVGIDRFVIELPASAEFLSVQIQRDEPQMWFVVSPNETMTQSRIFVTRGTGHLIDGDPGKYLGTFQLDEGLLVFHLFEIT